MSRTKKFLPVSLVGSFGVMRPKGEQSSFLLELLSTGLFRRWCSLSGFNVE